MPPKAAFFFGSGISFASFGNKDPMVDLITFSVLDDKWQLDEHGRFVPAKEKRDSRSMDVADRAQIFLRRLKKSAERDLRKTRTYEHARTPFSCNYEDLYACTLQLYQHRTRRLVNPLIATFDANIEADSKDLWCGQEAAPEEDAYTHILKQAQELIQWSVFHTRADLRQCAGRTVTGAATNRRLRASQQAA